MSHRVTRSTQKQSARTQASRTTVEASSKKRKASSRPVAKKSAQPIRPPQPTPEEEEEGNEPQEADESSPKRRRAGRRSPLVDSLAKEMDALIAKAKATTGGLQTLQERLREEVPTTQDRGEDEEEEEEEEVVEEAAEEQEEHYLHLPKDKIVRRRKPRPWSREEENFLIDLICKHGTLWSKFEQRYGHGMLSGRNQTAMKDKARNIMRAIINQGKEEEWVNEYPLWGAVSVGAARRGVHAYRPGEIPVRSETTYDEWLPGAAE